MDPVLIVGAGPTGLTAALELSRLGVAVRIVDRLAEPSKTSRAIGVQARTLELFAQRGLAAALVERGNRVQGGSIYADGARLFRLDFSRIDSRFPFILLVSQAETEQMLAEALARQGIGIERGVSVTQLSQTAQPAAPSPVTALLQHTDGRLETTRAPWLISAEGAHSLVRATLELPFEGATRPGSYALGDLRLDGDLPATDMHVFASPHGLLAVFPLGPGHVRLIASDPVDRAAEATPPSLAALQAIYDERSHIPARLHDLAWSSWFHINSRMVARLRVGRMLLGGDAAHIHSPAGAQGMNTGIQDMINLCWKLALIIKGDAAEALLDSYGQDRLPVIRRVLARTERLTDVIGTENPLLRLLFDHLGGWLGGTAIVQSAATAQMSQIALDYRDSDLSANHPHGGGLHAGDRVPDIAVRVRGDGGWREAALLDVLDPSRLVLLVVRPDAAAAPKRLAEAVKPWARLIDVTDITAATDAAQRARFEAAFGRLPAAFLVRPDGYLALTAGEQAAAGHVQDWCRRWLTAG